MRKNKTGNNSIKMPPLDVPPWAESPVPSYEADTTALVNLTLKSAREKFLI